MDYKNMYLLLMDASDKVIDLLIEAHQEAERLYIEHEKTPIELVSSTGPPTNSADQCN